MAWAAPPDRYVPARLRDHAGQIVKSGVVYVSTVDGLTKLPIEAGVFKVGVSRDPVQLFALIDSVLYNVRGDMPAANAESAEFKLGAAGASFQTRDVMAPPGAGQPPGDGGIAGPGYTECGDAAQALPGQGTGINGAALTSISGQIASGTDADIFSIRIPAGSETSWTITTVGTAGTVTDTQLFLFDSTGRGITSDDDNPGGGGLRSTIIGGVCPTPAGVYYIAISGYDFDPVNSAAQEIWFDTPFAVQRCPDGPGAGDPVLANWAGGSASGAYTMNLTNIQATGGVVSCTTACCFAGNQCQVLSPAACQAQGGVVNASPTCTTNLCLPCSACVPNAEIDEAGMEANCGLPDTVDGGCNTSTTDPAVIPIHLGDRICGSGAFDGATRDTDWFEIVIDSPTPIRFCATAGFDMLMGVINNNGTADCSQSGAVAPFALVPSCAEGCVQTTLNPGTWWLFVAPQFTSAQACPTAYRAELQCVPGPCVPPVGACCNNNTGACSGVADAGACTASGGTYQGNGTTCSPSPCHRGACCNVADRSCSLLSPGGCAAGGNFYSGDGTTCAPNNCPPLGACCVGTNCTLRLRAGCQGTFQGDNTNCGALTYSATPGNNALIDIRGDGALGCVGDDCSLTTALGFTFSYFGTPQSTIDVGSNGHMRFGGPANVFGNPATLPTADAYNGVIAPWWDDWRTDLCGQLHTRTDGPAGSRRFIAQWTNVCHFNNNAILATFEVILSETTNCIEFRWDTPLGSIGPVSGIENGDGTVGNDVTANAASGASMLLCPVSTQNPCTNPCSGQRRGDTNGDNLVNNIDIDPFVLGLVNFPAYVAQFCGGNNNCATCRVDINQDGAVNNLDIDPFVRCLVNLGCP